MQIILHIFILYIIIIFIFYNFFYFMLDVNSFDFLTAASTAFIIEALQI